MISYKDRIFCASPNCNNDCGRQLTSEDKRLAIQRCELICSAYFCGEPDCDHTNLDTNICYKCGYGIGYE
jgi:hypothetical protein